MEDLDYLNDTRDSSAFIADIRSKIGKLHELEAVWLDLQERTKQAEHDYLRYKDKVVVSSMLSAGIEQLTGEDGTQVALVRKYYCSPNKNDADKRTIQQWLEEHGGSFLLKEKAEVDGSQLDALEESGIPFNKKADVNTMALKSFLLSQLGLKGGVAQIEEKDIPECMHFSTVMDVTLSSV